MKKFSSSAKGLSENEAKKRLVQFGKNELKKKQGWKWPKLILGQFNDALVWILLVAAFLAFIFSCIPGVASAAPKGNTIREQMDFCKLDCRIRL